MLNKGKDHNWMNVRAKIYRLDGTYVLSETTQPTAPWSNDKWFRDTLKVVDTEKVSPKKTDDKYRKQIEILNEQLRKYKSAAEEERLKRISEQRLKLEEQNKRLEAEGNAARANQSMKKTNEKMQDKIAELNELKTDLAEKEILIANINIDQKELTSVEKKQIEEDQKLLDQMNLVGTSRAIIVRGHPRRTLALRLGVKMTNSSRLNMKILEKTNQNKYKVELIDYDVIGVAAFGCDYHSNSIYAATFFSIHHNWLKVEGDVLGISEMGLKDRLDISEDDLLKFHLRILSQINSN